MLLLLSERFTPFLPKSYLLQFSCISTCWVGIPVGSYTSCHLVNCLGVMVCFPLKLNNNINLSRLYTDWGWFCKVCDMLLSTWLFATPWTVAYQDPQSVGFSRKIFHPHWSGLPFPSPGGLPDPGLAHNTTQMMVTFVVVVSDILIITWNRWRNSFTLHLL